MRKAITAQDFDTFVMKLLEKFRGLVGGRIPGKSLKAA